MRLLRDPHAYSDCLGLTLRLASSARNDVLTQVKKIEFEEQAKAVVA